MKRSGWAWQNGIAYKTAWKGVFQKAVDGTSKDMEVYGKPGLCPSIEKLP